MIQLFWPVPPFPNIRADQHPSKSLFAFCKTGDSWHCNGPTPSGQSWTVIDSVGQLLVDVLDTVLDRSWTVLDTLWGNKPPPLPFVQATPQHRLKEGKWTDWRHFTLVLLCTAGEHFYLWTIPFPQKFNSQSSQKGWCSELLFYAGYFPNFVSTPISMVIHLHYA